MSGKIKVVTRNSHLSLLQVKEVFSHLPLQAYNLIPLASFGDKNKEISLMDVGIPGDFFTRELDTALLNGTADVAIHSAKDLPYPLPSGLEVYCLTEAKDKSDSLVSKGNLTLQQLPLGARIGTSSLKRKNELLKLRPDLTIVSIRGTIEERIAQVDSGFIDALIVATCALQRLGLDERIAEVLPFKTHALQGNLAVVGRAGKAGALKSLFSPLDIRQRYGKVTLIGFGPGNPDLLTIAGDKVLQKAGVIFHDDLIDVDFLEKYKAEKVCVGKRKGKHRHHQDEINELVYQAAVSGINVVRLKGGDPMIFAHGREEIDSLQSRLVEVAVIPGISSGIAMAAYTHIPLTHRGMASSVSFVTGHSENAQIPSADTLVYYMAGAKISGIAKKLIAAGWDAETSVALVHNVSLPNQKIFYSTLKELRYSVIKYPTPILIVVGDVVSFESGNARQQNVLETGTIKEYKGLENIIHTPLITVQKSQSNAWHQILKEKINTYDWIIFTSRYGVRFFFEALDELELDIRALSAIKIASVGKTTTAELKKYRLYPDIESLTESAEGLVNYFKESKERNVEILLPRSDKGLRFLSDELKALGNHVTDIPVYENRINKEARKVDLSDFQKIVFSSPSSVDAFRLLYGELPEGIQLVARGKTTENEIIQSLN